MFPKTGCNRGIGCRLCFRAETLRLALHGAGGNDLHRVTWFGMFFLPEVGPKPFSDKYAGRIVAGTRLTAYYSVARTQRPFLSYTGRGAVFLFGKTKRKIGGAHYAAHIPHTGKKNGLPQP